MRYILSVGILALMLTGCFKTGTVGIEDMQSKWDKVKECMNMPDAEPPNLEIVQGDSVMCSGEEKKGCYIYDTNTALLPNNTDWETVMHEYVHAICYQRDGVRDNDHKCKIGNDSAYLKCAGVVIDD